MRRNNLSTCAIAVMVAVLVTPAPADTNILTLNNDPFTRPDILKKKSQRPRANSPASLLPEQIELKLTATMVSENAPMVIVNGEMLAIGEKIGKMKLIAVLEGEAIFSQGGKKYSFMIDTLKLK